MAILNSRTLAVGALFLVISGWFFVESLQYDYGSIRQMGPAYFPRVVSVLLALLGFNLVVGSLVSTAPREALERWNMRALFGVTGSVVLFALALRPFGLILSMLLLVIVASLSSKEFRWRGVVVTGLVLASLCAGIFVFGLGLRVSLLPSFPG